MSLFKQEDDYYKLTRVGNFWYNNYIEYESNSDKNRNLSLDEYLNKIKPYLRNIIIDLQKSDTQKIQLTFAINFISSKDVKLERVMHSKSDNMKFTPYNDANEVIDKLFKSLRSRYQGNLETSIRGSDFIFNLVQMMYYKCHKINFKRTGSYIDSSDCIKMKKAIRLKNTDDKCFQYTVTVTLNYGEIKWNPEGASNIKPFINKYD